ncbi:MAG: DUF5916 domain-containing protein [Thermoanaerobaculia bacterium]
MARAVPPILAVTLLLAVASPLEAQTAGVVPIARTTGPIVVDGAIDEAAWAAVAPLDLPHQFIPRENEPAPVRTEVRLAYDENHLYAAFHAFDPDPESIRAHLTDRDEIFPDDFVGLVLDTFYDDRRGFELFVNPLGIQGDLILNEVAGGNEDPTWDAIWSSAGRETADGYIVEMAIPFSSLRFPRTSGPQTWGIELVRNYPRSERFVLTHMPFDRDVRCRLCQDARLVGLEGIEPGRNIQLTPTVTAHDTARREEFPSGRLDGGDTEVEAGVTAEWGVTPNMIVSGTINPDFSQVEADAVQLDINTQFTLFFQEKRPFFVEGADYFETPLSAIYTRTIADPDWGAKVTGKEGRSAIGFFTAEDVVTNLIIPGSQGSRLTSLATNNLATVLRYRHDVGESSTLGVLVTDRQGDDYSNRVAGIDGFFRFSSSDAVEAQVLWSETRYPEDVVAAFGQPDGTFDDPAILVSYRHDAKEWSWRGSYTDVGTGFRADVGFMPQVDYRRTAAGVERAWWGGDDDWYTQIFVESDWERTEEQSGELLEDEREIRAGVLGPLQSFALVNAGSRERSFGGRTFDETYLSAFAEMRPSGSLYFWAEAFAGDEIDFAHVRPAERLLIRPGATIHIGRRLRAEISHTFDRLDVEGGRLFDANVTEARVVHQFNARTFLRAILQYTEIDRNPARYAFPVEETSQRLAPQLLFSYKLNPQTVFFLGYTETALGSEQFDLTQRDRTLFAKVGYAFLF